MARHQRRQVKRSLQKSKVAHRRAASPTASWTGGAILNAVSLGMMALILGLLVVSGIKYTGELNEKLERIETARFYESVNNDTTVDSEAIYKEAYERGMRDAMSEAEKHVDSLSNIIVRYDELLQFYVATPLANK